MGDVTADGIADLIVSATKVDDDERDVGAVYTIPGQMTNYTNTSFSAFSSIVGSSRRSGLK